MAGTAAGRGHLRLRDLLGEIRSAELLAVAERHRLIARVVALSQLGAQQRDGPGASEATDAIEGVAILLAGVEKLLGKHLRLEEVKTLLRTVW